MADTALTMPRLAFGVGPLKMAGDDRLAALAAAGDERAFAAIFERHHQVLYRYCRSILGNDEDASDALQSTMLRALRALPGEKRTIALKPWLFRIAHNEAISIVRRRRPQVDVEDEALGLHSAGLEVDSDVRERVDRLFEDLRELPDRQRSALIMRELSGLSYDEIAAALRTSTGAATQAVFGARKALHEFAEGRDMLCDDIRRDISRRDGRILASRRIRSHLRDCEGCTAFQAMIAERERQFAAIAPPLPAIAAAAMLQNLQGGGGMGGGGLTGLTGAGSSHALISAAALKAAPILAAAAVGGGAGAIVGSDVAPINTWAEPAALVRAYAETAADAALAAAPVVVPRVAAVPAGSRPDSRSPDARNGAAPESPAPASDGTERLVAQTPAARAPAAGDPSPQAAPPAPAPKRQSAPKPGSRPAPPLAAPTRTPTSAPAPTNAPTSTDAPTPAQAPAPAPGPTTTSPPPAEPGDGEPDDNTDDKPRKKPHPCRPEPAPRGHPDEPCPS